MILWLWRLIWGESECRHCWRMVEEIDLYDDATVETVDDMLPIGSRFIQECEHCGLMRSFDC